MLAENLKQVEENIAAACERAGRKREEVTLIAVSKTKPISMLSEIYDCGIRILEKIRYRSYVKKESSFL